MYLAQDIPAFVMYCVYRTSCLSIHIESTDSVIQQHVLYIYHCTYIIESVDSISRDERVARLTQYITNAGIARARYSLSYFKHYHRVLRLISNRMSV